MQKIEGLVNRLASFRCLVSGEQSEVKKSKKNEEGSLFSSLLSLLCAARWNILQRISKTGLLAGDVYKVLQHARGC